MKLMCAVIPKLFTILLVIYVVHAISADAAAEPKQGASQAAASKTVKTWLGSLVRVERRNECRDVVIEFNKPPRREIRKPQPGSEIIVLTFAGKCTEQSSCQSDVALASGLQSLLDPGTSIVRVG